MKPDCSYLICKNLFLSFIPMLLQITDDNYVEFLAGWQIENKPNVLLFDQVPQVPLIYKVSHYLNTQQMHKLDCLHIK